MTVGDHDGRGRGFSEERTGTVRRLSRPAPLVAVFWLVLSGHYTTLLLSLGAFSVVLVSWLALRADVIDSQRITARRIALHPKYLVWLGTQVLISAAGVARLAWGPRDALQPVVESVPLPAMSALGQVTYANSITFTPGTLALDLHDDHITIHSLDAASVESLRGGGMVRRVQQLEDPR